MFALAAVVILTGSCAQKVNDVTVTAEPGDNLYFVRGYRSDDDPCKLTGETGFTNQFLDDSADLVSCPEAYRGLANFVTVTGARVVAEKDGFVLLSISRR